MFTIKVYERNPDGSVISTLLEATQVRNAGNDIVCDLEDGSQITYSRRPGDENDVDQKLYVMNRDGATVATYTL